MQPMQTGTTTVALKYSNGVVLAADRRVSISTGLVVSRSYTKIVPLADFVAITVSGLVADAQKLSEFLGARIKKFTLERRRKPLIREISRYLSIIMHTHLKSRMPLLTHIIVGGVDIRGPHIFFLDDAGSVVEDDFLSSGSGSPVAYGYLEAAYREDLSEEEAIGIAVKAIRSAIMRDVATGDGIDVVVISDKGLKRLTDAEVKKYL
jgi:proteasome beta subunit